MNSAAAKEAVEGLPLRGRDFGTQLLETPQPHLNIAEAQVQADSHF